VLSGFINLLILIVGFIVLYYAYQYFFGTAGLTGSVIESGKITANQGLKTYTNQAKMYEGGEYSVNLWMYVSGWSYLQGTRKHVVEIGGSKFSSLLLALGSYKNSLSVRVDTTDASGNPVATTGGLTTADKNQFFTPLTSDTSDLTTSTQCDIDTIDLQRWVQVTVVLNGNICDVFMDGKLVRSCVLPSYYKVDQSSQLVKVVDRGGFDGYVSNISTYNYALNPTTIYNMYMSGPQPISFDIWSAFNYIKSLFQTKKN